MTDELALLKRKLARERAARKEAERLLEDKALQLYYANEQLRALNADLEQQVRERTEQLKEEQARYRILVENAGDLIFWIDREGRISSLNPVAARFFQMPEGELLGRHFSSFLLPEHMGAVQAFFAQQIRLQQANSYYELPLRVGAGTVHWLSVQTSFRFGADGLPEEVSVIARDITARVEAERELSSVNLRFRVLLENLQAGIMVEDENRRIVLVNQRFCDMFGIDADPQHLMGQHCGDAAQQSSHLFADGPHFEQRVQDLLLQKRLSTGEELALKDGRTFLRNFIPIFRGEHYLGHLWYYEDISDRKQADALIRRSEEKYRGIIENMELGLLEVDNYGIITRAYKRFCELTGYGEAEMLGKSADDLFLPPEYRQVLEEQSRQRAEGKAGVYEVEMFVKGGGRKWVLISGAPFFDENGRSIGSIGIHYDISAQKKLQRELEEARRAAERARDAEKEFLANMSHEIRNPINTIIGMTHLLFDTQPSAEQLEYLQNIKHTSDILLALVSDILDISKITEGKLELAPRTFNLGELVNATAQTMAFRIREKGIDFVLDMAGSLQREVSGDSTFLNQILLNLLGNAYKFTERGRISLRAWPCEGEPGDMVCFEVKDSGIGIPADRLGAVFERFSQAGKATKHKYGGTGLGLPITQRLVEIHGGRISVASEPGKGTTFTFTLRFEPPADHAQHSAEDGVHDQSQRVLIVEDNEMNQLYIQRLLAQQGIEHRTAGHGKVALEWLARERFDLILMDIRMPEMDGYETTIRLRSSSQNPNCHIPIIALTASALLDEKEKALACGMNYHLTKPFTPGQLYQLINSATARHVPLPAPAAKAPDADVLHDLYGGDAAQYGIMLDIFNSSVPPDVDRFAAAAQAADWGQAQRLAHKLKSSFALVGFAALAKALGEFEAEGQPDAEEAELLLAQMRQNTAWAAQQGSAPSLQ